MSARVLYLCVRLSHDHLFQNSQRDCGGIEEGEQQKAGETLGQLLLGIELNSTPTPTPNTRGY